MYFKQTKSNGSILYHSVNIAYTKQMSRDGFLKSALQKKVKNKTKPEPCMRIDVLLECTCKRLRNERKQQSKERLKADDEAAAKHTKQKCIGDENLSDILNENIDMQCSDICSMIDEKELFSNSSNLWNNKDDVKEFLSQVTADSNNNKSADTSESLCKKNETVDCLTSLVSNYDIGSFTMEFDSLYKELVQNLVSVETFITQSPACK